jgi:putative hemolysin
VSTTEKALNRQAFDLPWAPFTAKLVRSTKATVVPVYLTGQNSRLFQIASHLSLTLRLSLVFRETARRIGSDLAVRVGKPIPYAALEHMTNRADLLLELRRRTCELVQPGDINCSLDGFHLREGRIKGWKQSGTPTN